MLLENQDHRSQRRVKWEGQSDDPFAQIVIQEGQSFEHPLSEHPVDRNAKHFEQDTGFEGNRNDVLVIIRK